MILGIGIDSVEIDRFEKWHLYKCKSLTKIFNQIEIDYCLSNNKKSAERFAVRFAAKEAFLKAIFQHTCQKKPLTLLTICKNVALINAQSGMPELVIDWKNLLPYLTIQTVPLKVHVSLTHSNTLATAFIILEKII